MASKDLSVRQKFALYGGAAVLSAAVPFASNFLTVSDAELFERVRHDVITKKINAPLEPQIKQAAEAAEHATTPSLGVNIKSQQTLDLKALNEEVVAKVAEQKAELLEASFKMSPIFALIGLVGVIHSRTLSAQSRKRKEDAPKP